MEDASVVTKVMDLNEVELVELHGRLTHSRSFDNAKVIVVNPVPVLGVNGPIGYASVDAENLECDVFLTKECPERLDMDNGEHFFLAIEDASSIFRGGEGDYPVLTSIEIKMIRLRSAKNGSNLPIVTRGLL